MIKNIKKYFYNKINKKVSYIEKIPSYRNTVYKIQTDDTYFILKIFRGENSTIRSRTEAEIYKKYNLKSKLIPHLYFEDFTLKDLNFPVICSEYRDGENLKYKIIFELKHGDENIFKHLIKKSIDVANRVHKLKTSNSCGTLFSNYSGSYLEFVLHQKNSTLGLSYGELYDFLTKYDNKKLMANYLNGKNLVIPDKFTLCHNDFRGREILVNGDCASVVDWEGAIFSDPLGDFGSHLFSLLDAFYDNTLLQEKIIHTFIEYLPKKLYIQSLAFYLAERALLTSKVYNLKHDPKRFKWAMKFAKNMLSNNLQNATDLIHLIRV